MQPREDAEVENWQLIFFVIHHAKRPFLSLSASLQSLVGSSTTELNALSYVQMIIWRHFLVKKRIVNQKMNW
jgi:hypothetical protein